MSFSKLTSLSGMFSFCSFSACCALRWMRTASGREMFFMTRYLRRVDISCDCLLEMICRRVIAVVSEPSSVEEIMKPPNSTATVKIFSRFVFSEVVPVTSPTSMAIDHSSEVRYRSSKGPSAKFSSTLTQPAKGSTVPTANHKHAMKCARTRMPAMSLQTCATSCNSSERICSSELELTRGVRAARRRRTVRTIRRLLRTIPILT
mmetsp:Transcript_54408/g.165302  ORF Transcript_54408/g.165302 Transcript_54408/m.165302 type:complete len:205 (+) Transcript_54408:1080-1694(+)